MRCGRCSMMLRAPWTVRCSRENSGNTVSTARSAGGRSRIAASDQPNLGQTQAAQTETRSGKQRIVLTQPLGTTVEDTEPTFTWDVSSEGWTYRVHVEDRDSHQTIATSPVLDEALWRVSNPLLRGPPTCGASMQASPEISPWHLRLRARRVNFRFFLMKVSKRSRKQEPATHLTFFLALSTRTIRCGVRRCWSTESWSARPPTRLKQSSSFATPSCDPMHNWPQLLSMIVALVTAFLA